LGIGASPYLQPALMKYSVLLDRGAASGYGSHVPRVAEDPRLEFLPPGVSNSQERIENLLSLRSDRPSTAELWRHGTQAPRRVSSRSMDTIGPCDSPFVVA
jgi:hypothetical protein